MNQIVTFDKMQTGKKGSGKHWTKEEVKKREAATKKVKRKKIALPKMPEWLSEEAKVIWKQTLKDMKGLDILDRVDANAIATYCDAEAKYRDATAKVEEYGYTTENSQGTESISPYVKAAQGYVAIKLQYEKKLGLDPESRARIAKKIADEEVDPNAGMFGD